MKRIKSASINNLFPVIAELLDYQDVKLTIKGNSMYPLLRSNVDSVVLTKKTKITRYGVFLYKRDTGEYIIHRVVGKKNGAYCMAGDFEQKIEYPVYEHQVLAAVKGFYRGDNYISCASLLYGIYSFLWVLLFPNRHRIISIFKKMRYVLKIKRRKLL